VSLFTSLGRNLLLPVGRCSGDVRTRAQGVISVGFFTQNTQSEILYMITVLIAINIDIWKGYAVKHNNVN